MSSSESRGWLPSGKSEERGWRLDIVSLLAVIGESSIEGHSQTLTSSWTCILPRIIPAPQALLKATRPARLPQLNAIVVGVHNGTKVDSLNYFPNIIHSIEDLPAYSFKVYRIRHRKRPPLSAKGASNGVPPAEAKSFGNHSLGSSFKERVVGRSNDHGTKPHVPAAKYSPLNLLSVLSCLMTIGILVWAIIEHDGTAILAVGAISIVSSIVGLASWWQPALMNRSAAVPVPDGDVVIRTREGSFIVVKCNEDVARELYTGTEECDYYIKSRPVYRLLVGIGTFLLMMSVVLLGNCKWTMQAAIGSSYILLNGAYWLASLLEKDLFWDLDTYEWEDVTPPDSKRAEFPKPTDDTVGGQYGDPSFTRTLWYAIRETGKTGWVTRSGAAPATTQWDSWLQEAQDAVVNNRRAWPAVSRKDDLIGETDALSQSMAAAEKGTDTAQQHAPAVNIPPPSRQ